MLRSVSSPRAVKSIGPLTLKEVLLDHAKHGQNRQILKDYQQMIISGITADQYVFVCVIKACALSRSLTQGNIIYSEIVECGYESHAFIGSTLITMYLKCGSVLDSENVFFRIPNPDLVTLNAMVASYARCGHLENMLKLFQQMKDGGVTQNIVTWNTIIAGYTQHQHNQEAVQLFFQMQQEGWVYDDVTFASVITACTNMRCLIQGKIFHVQVVENRLESDVYVGNTLINFYMRCGKCDHAEEIFERLPKHDPVTWNMLLAGYAIHGLNTKTLETFHYMQKMGHIPDLVTWNTVLTTCVQNGCGEQALVLFKQMHVQGKDPDAVTMINALKACSLVAAPAYGKVIHSYIVDIELMCNLSVNNAVIDMYSKCGSLNDASRIFQASQMRDLVTWNTLISGYFRHSYFSMVIEYFEMMLLDGFQPDDVTFVCLLSAWTQIFSEKGYSHFRNMIECHTFPLTLKQYNGLLDSLGQKGLLREAQTLLSKTVAEEKLQGLSFLLNHCKTYGDVQLGRKCFDQLIPIEGDT